MRRLSYSPRIDAWVKTDWGIVDISPFIVSGTITRRVNQVSSASLVIRNPNFRWTNRRVRLRPDPQTGQRIEEVLPVFHPMDPITITLTRIKDRPVQVFTGYLDKTPYVELYPGTVSLEASCTLKRILHTYWDPATLGSLDLMAKYGWILSRDGQFLGPQTNTAQDASFGKLLEQVLIQVGGWHHANIHIGKIPDGLPEKVSALAKEVQQDSEAAKKELDRFMATVIGVGSYGSGSVTSGGSGGSAPGGGLPTGVVAGEDKITQKMCEIAKSYGIPPELALATTYLEWGGQKDSPTNPTHTGWFQAQNQETGGSHPYAYGPWSTHVPTVAETHDLGLATTAFSAAAAGWAKADPSLRQNLRDWAMKTQGVTCGKNPLYCSGAFETALTKARANLSKYGCGNSGLTPNAPVAHAARVVSGRVKTSGGTQQSVTSMAPGISPSAVPTSGGGSYGAPRSYGRHAGVDIAMPEGTKLTSIVSGTVVCTDAHWYNQGVKGTGVITIKSDQAVGPYPAGTIFGYGHSDVHYVTVGQHVAAGQLIGLSGAPDGGPHLHFFINTAGVTCSNGNTDPTSLAKSLLGGTSLPITGGGASTSGGGGSGGGSGSGGGGSSGSSGGNGGGIYGGPDPIPWSQVRSEAKAAAFAAILEAPSLEQIQESALLTGKRSLMNDKPLLPFIEQLCTSSMRTFMSLPNGDFFAFYPDYFGGLGRQPYWEIDDIEILDGKIELSDDALATHVYVVGDTSAPFQGFGGDGIDIWDMVQSIGVVTIQDAFRTQFINFDMEPDVAANERDGGKITQRTLDLRRTDDANAFLTTYGARPKLLEMPMIRNPWYELFMAYQTFCLMWSQQFLTDFTFTFMPELFPGGLVSFPAHGIQCYVNEVTHIFDYENGFNTQATLMAPSATPGSHSRGVNVGMVRSGVLGKAAGKAANAPAGTFDPGADKPGHSG